MSTYELNHRKTITHAELDEPFCAVAWKWTDVLPNDKETLAVGCHGNDKIVFFDITDVDNPTYLTSYSNATSVVTPWKLAVDTTELGAPYMYVLSRDGGATNNGNVLILNVSDPSTPTYVVDSTASLNTPYDFDGPRSGVIYVIDGNNNLIQFLSNPSIGSLGVGTGYPVVASGPLRGVVMSNPFSPTLEVHATRNQSFNNNYLQVIDPRNPPSFGLSALNSSIKGNMEWNNLAYDPSEDILFILEYGDGVTRDGALWRADGGGYLPPTAPTWRDSTTSSIDRPIGITSFRGDAATDFIGVVNSGSGTPSLTVFEITTYPTPLDLVGSDNTDLGTPWRVTSLDSTATGTALFMVTSQLPDQVVIFEAGPINSSSSSSEQLSSSSSSSEQLSESSSSSSSTSLGESTSSSESSVGYSSVSDSSSSSSSSLEINARDIQNAMVINAEHHDIIPFTFIAENGTESDLGDDSRISFTIEGSSTPYLDYDAILEMDNSALLTSEENTPTVYVPEDERAKYKHEESFYVDIIAKDVSGIKSVRTHVEPDKYEWEDITDDDNTFFVPKFTWGETNVAATTTTTTTTSAFQNLMWVGTENGELQAIEYTTDAANVYSTQTLVSPVNKILFGINNHFMYVSTFDNLYKYAADQFQSGNELSEVLSTTNTERMIMDAYKDDNDSVWAVDSYQGRVFRLDPDDLSIQETFEDFASPYKIRYSEYHDAYFVADSFVLWQIDSNGVMTDIYEVNDYELMDIDVSETGIICLVLNGSFEDIIRVLDTDKYSFLVDERVTTANLRFCTYCGEGRFYILGELDTTSDTYSSAHYVFDVGTQVLTRTDSSEALSVTTTTTTPGTTTKAVEVTEPNGGEELQLGNEYQITWISSKSASDAVKIDLYKGGSLYSNIVESTENIGIYAWTIPTNIDEGEDYKVRVTWESASSDPNNYDESDNNFSIAETISATTTTTTLPFTESAIGVAYDGESDQVVIMLQSGLFSVFTLADKAYYGLIESGATDIVTVAIKPYEIDFLDKQTKVRIFVGSEQHYSDKWDSGIIETELVSMYYGGGNNLVPGKKYYVHIQTYSELTGWGEIQIKEFIMPK